MHISTRIEGFWREVERVMTAATQPILIIASAIAAADVFSGNAISARFPFIGPLWACARALAVTIWLGMAYEKYLEARQRHTGGGWWLLLTLALFLVDMQVGMLFARDVEHVAAVGSIPLVTIPMVYWVGEQVTLGVVLIAVSKAITFSAPSAALAHVTTVELERSNVRQDASAVLRREPPLARRAYYDRPVEPISDGGSEDDTDGGAVYRAIEYVTAQDEPPARAGVTRHTAGKQGRKPRSDRGRVSMDPQTRVQRLLGQMRQLGRVMTIRECMVFLDEQGMGVSRGTAVGDRDDARRLYLNEKTV